MVLKVLKVVLFVFICIFHVAECTRPLSELEKAARESARQQGREVRRQLKLQLQQEQQVALRDSAVKIKITTAQLANIGHAVVIKVDELRQRNVVD